MLKKILILIILLLFVILNINSNIENYLNIINNHFKIIVTTYNPGLKLLKKCLNSIEIQNYKNYEVCIIDDASTKEQEEIYNLLNKYNSNFNWKYLQSKINYGPCYSRNKAIEILNPQKNDIIICVDGDDELFDKNVLKKLNYYYQNENLLITFGNYIKKYLNKEDKNKYIKFKINELNNIILKKTFRKIKSFKFSHLKTFKFKLYDKINKKDLKINGEFVRSSTDIAIMLPMLEMAGKNIKFIDEKLYKYTFDHPESLHRDKIKKKKQKLNSLYIKSLDKYEEVDFNKLFFIHIPKNAGSSIEFISKNYNYLWGKEYSFNLNDEEIEKLVDNKSIWHVPPKFFPEKKNPYKKYINFAVVRNPYDRIISEYKYYKNIKNISEYDINVFINDIYYKFKENNFYYGCHFLPQSEFIFGYPKCDEILRFENLDSDFYNLLKKYNYPQMKLPIKNKSSGNETIKDLNSNSIKIINELYKEDFKNLGYKLIEI